MIAYLGIAALAWLKARSRAHGHVQSILLVRPTFTHTGIKGRGKTVKRGAFKFHHCNTVLSSIIDKNMLHRFDFVHGNEGPQINFFGVLKGQGGFPDGIAFGKAASLRGVDLYESMLKKKKEYRGRVNFDI